MREGFFNWLQVFRIVQYGVSALIIDPDGRVLLIKHRLRGTWEWPAGGGKLGELPDVAVQREALEESGVALTQPRLVAVFARRRRWLPTRFNFTFAETVSTEAAASARFDQVELTALRWAAPEEAGQVITPRLCTRFERALAAYQSGQVAYLVRED